VNAALRDPSQPFAIRRDGDLPNVMAAIHAAQNLLNMRSGRILGEAPKLENEAEKDGCGGPLAAPQQIHGEMLAGLNANGRNQGA
jgi:hypothetical protein